MTGTKIVYDPCNLISNKKTKIMKKFALASSVAVLLAGLYVGASQPVSHAKRNSQPTIYSMSLNDTVPNKKDSSHKKMPDRKDTTTKKDSTK